MHRAGNILKPASNNLLKGCDPYSVQASQILSDQTEICIYICFERLSAEIPCLDVTDTKQLTAET